MTYKDKVVLVTGASKGIGEGCVRVFVDALNSELGSWEKIKDFKLIPHDFSEEAGELTPTLKVKRRAVQERYREQIDEMYTGKTRPARAAH